MFILLKRKAVLMHHKVVLFFVWQALCIDWKQYPLELIDTSLCYWFHLTLQDVNNSAESWKGCYFSILPFCLILRGYASQTLLAMQSLCSLVHISFPAAENFTLNKFAIVCQNRFSDQLAIWGSQ